jgi:short-subunit dehydrogenase
MLALITGGDRGIGFAIANKLAEKGADIIIAARNKKLLAEAVEKIKKHGVNAWAFECDVASKKDIKKLATEVSKIGDLDTLINNAGVAYGKMLLKNSDEEISEMIDVNLRGVIDCTRAFLPKMVQRKKGMIINIASISGKHGYAELAVYCATKFGVVGFTEALAQEVQNDGVGVYAICPLGTATNMWYSLWGPDAKADYVPEDVAVEVFELIKNAKRIAPGSAIEVSKRR